MKIISLSIIILFLTGCGTGRLRTNISDNSQDVLSNESLARYSATRMKKIKQNVKNISGVSLCHQLKINQGLNVLKKELTKRKNDAVYWNHIGICYLLNNQTSKSLYYLNLANDTSKKNLGRELSMTHNNIGMIYFKNKHYTNAVFHFKKSISLGSHLLTPKYNLAQINLQFGLLNKAKPIFEELHKISSKDLDVINSLATIAMMQKDYPLANSYFAKISERQRKRSDISFNYSLLMYKQNNFVRSKHILSRQNPTQIRSLKKMSSELNKKIDFQLKSSKNRRGVSSDK